MAELIGLCDPMLPGNDNRESLFATFRARLLQASRNLRKSDPLKTLIIFIDAIDNAAIQAEFKHEESFPKLLLESLAVTGPIDGVKFVVSCRTHRRDRAKGKVECDEVELKPFSETETNEYLRARLPKGYRERN